MKKVDLKLMLWAVLVLFAGFTTSCKDDDDDKTKGSETPVLNDNFSFSVVGNTVTFTTSLTGNVWFKNEQTSIDYSTTDGKVEVVISKAGTYPFTCNTLIEGATVSSDTFNVVIESDDLGFLDHGYWKYLSGGANKSKTWRMDINSSEQSLYFNGPLYYSGETKDEYWSWDVLESELPYTNSVGTTWENFISWAPDYAGNTWIMAANDYGTITFSSNDGIAKTSKFGVEETGAFSFDTATMKIKLSGVTLPIDTARINEGQYTDLYTLRVYSLSDSSMQLGIKRMYEGGNISKWINVYNFICADYTYEAPETFSYSGAVKTSFTKDDLVGTWKFADVPQGWISYTKTGSKGSSEPARLFGHWDTREDISGDMGPWIDGMDSIGVHGFFDNNDTSTYVFNNDGSCVLRGVANTYSVNNGIITFNTELDNTEWNLLHNLSLSGTEIKVADVQYYGDKVEAYTPLGVWFGQQNGDKNEFKAVQLVKQN